MNLFPNNLFKKCILSTSICLLVSCGGTEEQDIGVEDARIAYTGLAIDGYLANALVWLDLDNNNSLDGFEPFAYTDSQGYFTYNPVSGINYCESDISSQQRFCLRSGAVTDQAYLKVSGGTDLVTGELFKGVMTGEVNSTDAESNLDSLVALGAMPEGDTSQWQTQIDDFQNKVSPLSTLASYLAEGTDLVTVLLDLGFSVPGSVDSETLLKVDYVAGLSLEDGVSESLFSAAVTLQRIVDTYTQYLDDAASALDLGEAGLPSSSASAVWQGVAQAIEQNSGGDTILDFALVADLAVTEFITQLNDSGDELSASALASIQSKATDQELLQNTALVAQAAEVSFVSAEQDNLIAAAQSLELLMSGIEKAIDGDASDRDFVALAEILTEPENTILQALETRQAQINASQASEIDLNTLTDLLFDELADNTDITSAIDSLVNEASLADLSDNESFWQGKQLSLSGVQDASETGQIVMFFDGTSEDASGDLTLCIAYQNTDDPSDNIEGQRFEGSWSMLDPASPNRMSLLAEGFSIQMKVIGETLGSDIPDDEQINSLTRDENSLYGKYRFVLNGDSASWHSDTASIDQSYGLLTFTDVPQSDQECQTLLSL